MPKPPPKAPTSNKTATASTPEGKLMRHVALLELKDADAYRIWCRENGFKSTLGKDWQARRDELLCAEKRKNEALSKLKLQKRLEALGIKSEEEYLIWCKSNGFPITLQKTIQQEHEERLARLRESSHRTLSSERKYRRKPGETLLALFQGDLPQAEINSPLLKEIKLAADSLLHPVPWIPERRLQKYDASLNTEGETPEIHSDNKQAFLNLLIHLGSKSRLLSADPAIEALGPQTGNSFLWALQALAKRSALWIRTPESWSPNSRNPHRQFASLARHLLAKYDVPAVLDEGWFEGLTEKGVRHQDWFLHIGEGKNLRTAEMEMKLTKRAAHLFPSAPKEFSIEAALRWCQTVSLGADDRLARTLATTRLAELQQDEEFWQSVVFFFINNPMLNPRQAAPLIDFIYNLKFVPTEVSKPDGSVSLEILEPNFSMKGRSGIALLCRMEEWHHDLSKETRRTGREWESCGLNRFEIIKKEESTGITSIWTMEELLSSKALIEEGKAMRHCVASYAASCAKGNNSIWSLKMKEGEQENSRRVMTVEVDNHRRLVCQARGKCNKQPGEKRASPRLSCAPEIIKRWAAQESLTIASHLF